MKKYICKLVRKDLSRAKHSGGIILKEYYENIFHNFYNSDLMISLKEFKSIISKDNFILIDYENSFMISLKPEYYKSNEYQENEEELYNYAYIKNLFKEENNTNILLIYKIIMDSEEITYSEIANIVNIVIPTIKLDKKQASHYCKILKKINLVYKTNKQNKQNERIVRKNEVDNLYNGNLIKNELESDDEDEENNSDNDNIILNDDSKGFYNFNLLQNYLKSNDPKNIFEITKDEVNYLNNSRRFNKHFIENRFSFIIDENNIENNLFFHLLISDGLTVNQVCSLLGFVGREKAIVRFLNNLEKKHFVKHSSVRKGKKYEFVYKIDESYNQVPSFIYKYVEYYKNKRFCKNDENNEIMNEKINKNDKIIKNINIIDTSNISIEQNNLTPIKIKNNNLTPIINLNLHKIDLNNFDFSFILEKINFSENYTNLKNKYKIDTDNINSIDLNSNDTKFNIILDFFFSNLKLLKLRTFDNVNYNRYLFCLNKISEKKILTMNDLKQYIIKDLESKIGFKIDRKTLRNALLNLENLGFIKTMEFELVMKNKMYTYENNKEELVQKKLVVMRRDIILTEDMIKDIEELIKPRIKSTNETDLEFLEINLEDDDVINNLNLFPFKKEKSIEMIKIEIDNLLNTVDVNISLDQKRLPKFIEKFEKIKLNHCKENFSFFMTKWKRSYFIKCNLSNLFIDLKNKRLEKEEENNKDKIFIFNLLESVSNQKIIVPEFMMNKLLGNYRDSNQNYDHVPQEKLFLQNSYSKICPDMANLITKQDEEKIKESFTNNYDFSFLQNFNHVIKNNIKNSFKQDLSPVEIICAKKYFTNNNKNKDENKLKNFLNNKRIRSEQNNNYNNNEDNFNKIPLNITNKLLIRYTEQQYKRKFDFYSVIIKIYFNPKITIKKLRHSFFNILPSEIIYADFLLYLNKMGLLKIGEMDINNLDFSKRVIKLEDSITLELDESARILLGIQI